MDGLLAVVVVVMVFPSHRDQAPVVLVVVEMVDQLHRDLLTLVGTQQVTDLVEVVLQEIRAQGEVMDQQESLWSVIVHHK
tara:strand:+ start:489 stop:728 length:240 start_codon:yes stop_codon:yes gene_type:complete